MEFLEEELISIEISDYETEREKPIPSILHSIVQSNLITFLNVYYSSKFRFLTEISQHITDKKTVPDIAVYEKFTIDWERDLTTLNLVPLLNIEILSPEQPLSVLEQKIKKYFEVGVKSSWIVFPSMKAIAVYHAAGKYKFFVEHETLKDSMLDIEIPLQEIFK
jgi:Uma2 family endonuclease